jgi:inner membrane protein
MDLVTQTVLGGAVGELVLGKKAGNKAMVWGAIGGLIPDLDVLVAPFFSVVDGLFVHRGFSHSLVFAFLLGPLLGWFIHRVHWKMNITWREWTRLSFWSLFTHPLLDYFTTYGTGAFLPFSNYRVELGTIGIVDIFYTVPLVLVLFINPFLRRSAVLRRRLVVGSLFLTSFYLLGTVGNKLYMNTVFKDTFAQQGIAYDRYKTAPLPLSNFLWMGMAEVDSGYYMALHSNFDSDKPTEFMYIPRNEAKLGAIAGDAGVQKLIRFSKGYYHVNEDENGLYLADLRFGKMGLDENAGFVFKFYLQNEVGEVAIRESTESRSMEDAQFSAFLARIKGI